jgi:two-component system, chemotaxis family, protein-glutamate methylesterase/glutaminase
MRKQRDELSDRMNVLASVKPSLSGLIVIGASTGGPRVLCDLIGWLPPMRACILIVQHFPKFINPSFVRTLSRYTQAPVRLIQDGDELADGTVLVAPSEVHCRVVGNRHLQLASGPKVNYVCPSIDVTMESVTAPAPGLKLIGALLTGMGQDGAAGLAHIKRLGGLTVAQNQATCAVYGMPARAVERGCVDFELPPEEIAALLAQEAGATPG